jgi:hypothetical protein
MVIKYTNMAIKYNIIARKYICPTFSIPRPSKTYPCGDFGKNIPSGNNAR